MNIDDFITGIITILSGITESIVKCARIQCCIPTSKNLQNDVLICSVTLGGSHVCIFHFFSIMFLCHSSWWNHQDQQITIIIIHDDKNKFFFEVQGNLDSLLSKSSSGNFTGIFASVWKLVRMQCLVKIPLLLPVYFTSGIFKKFLWNFKIGKSTSSYKVQSKF